MKIVKDSRILNAIARRYLITFDSFHKYATAHEFYSNIDYKGCSYELKYVDGCFYPYLFRIA